MDTKKQTVRINVDNNDLETNMSIPELLQIITAALERGATHADVESEYESSCGSISLYYEREETDIEFHQRLEKEKRDNDLRIAYKRREYERLKKELGE